MEEKMDSFRSAFSDLIRTCMEIDRRSFQDAVSAIHDEMGTLEDDEMEAALSLLDELMVHVRALDEEFSEPYIETINDIEDMAEDIRNDANSA